MEKRGVLVVLSLFLINFVSAQFDFGYGGFSLSNFFDSLDPSTVTYILLFLIIFTLVFLAISRVNLFKNMKGEPNTAASGVIAFSVSALIVYYLYRSGYNIESFFYDLGFSGNLFSLVAMIALVLFAIFIVIKFKFAGFFIVSGLLLMFISIFTDIIYEKTTAFFIGLGLLIIGIFLGKAMRKWWGKNIRSY
jgi:hypothetical protein